MYKAILLFSSTSAFYWNIMITSWYLKYMAGTMCIIGDMEIFFRRFVHEKCPFSVKLTYFCAFSEFLFSTV